MRKISLFIFVFLLKCHLFFAQESNLDRIPVLVIHGGAGNINPDNMDGEEEDSIRNVMSRTLDRGHQLLSKGASSVEVVRECIKMLENSPFFNAGRGAVFNNKGEHELDASIMNGENLQAGAVAGVKRIKNPIEAAYLVMKQSRHVMLVGEGAEEFAAEYGAEEVENDYFDTEKRRRQLEYLKLKEGEGKSENRSDEKYGTVGVVALDKNGNIAAGTSTGGLSNKKYGRVGDSPIIGAGTYADNNTCGISATGTGEYFIRGVIAYNISAQMEYNGVSLEEAAQEAIHHKLTEMGGDGGIIGLDKKGNIAMVFNTRGMIRGYVNKTGDKKVLLFEHE